MNPESTRNQTDDIIPVIRDQDAMTIASNLNQIRQRVSLKYICT
jgi:hypothetical protein